MKERGFDWWVARVRRALALYDVIRLDHFRGFEAFWSIPADEETAINGQWVKAPGHDLFQRLKDVFGNLPFVAEDLGLITFEVDELREHFVCGDENSAVRVSDRGSHLYLPHRYVPNTVAYTGTHDNNTTLGWWREGATDVERANVQTYLQTIEHEGDIVWAMMRAAARSVANLCVFPMQDVLHRMQVVSPVQFPAPLTAIHPRLAPQMQHILHGKHAQICHRPGRRAHHRPHDVALMLDGLEIRLHIGALDIRRTLAPPAQVVLLSCCRYTPPYSERSDAEDTDASRGLKTRTAEFLHPRHTEVLTQTQSTSKVIRPRSSATNGRLPKTSFSRWKRSCPGALTHCPLIAVSSSAGIDQNASKPRK